MRTTIFLASIVTVTILGLAASAVFNNTAEANHGTGEVGLCRGLDQFYDPFNDFQCVSTPEECVSGYVTDGHCGDPDKEPPTVCETNCELRLKLDQKSCGEDRECVAEAQKRFFECIKACMVPEDIFEKTLVEDPAKSNIECTTGMPIGALTTTMCTFLLEYTGDSLLIVDTVPAEWKFVSQTGTCDVGPAGKGNPSKSATKIDCGVTDSLSEEFTFQTRQSPGKNNVKFAPTSCDKELKLNESALALDPITMEIIKTSNMIGTPTVDDPNDTDCDQVENDKDQCPFSDPINFGPIDRWGCDNTQVDS